MSIIVSSIFNDVVLDDASKDSNGDFSIERFNRLSKRAELRFLDWLTGDTKGGSPPPPLNQKNRDFLSPFIKKYTTSVYGGTIQKPSDFYSFDNMYLLRADKSEGCDDDSCQTDENEPARIVKQPIEVLSNDKFSQRVSTWIDELKPTLEVPIAKISGNNIEFYPEDIGSIQLEYIRYPVFARIVSKIDLIYNNEVPDEALSVSYEWPDFARSYLIWYVADIFSNSTSNTSMKQLNIASHP
ncbi:MAG: hypothetical protein ABIN25_07185 [Ginsengibacter sp.]